MPDQPAQDECSPCHAPSIYGPEWALGATMDDGYVTASTPFTFTSTAEKSGRTSEYPAVTQAPLIPTYVQN